MLKLISYANNVSNFSRINTPHSSSTEDVLNLIRALRDERSEDIKDRIMNDLQKKEQIDDENNTANKRSRKMTKLK